MSNTSRKISPPVLVRTGQMAWVPTGPGKSFRPIRFWPGGWSELMRLEPGAEVPRHRHTGAVDALVLQGQRRLSSGEVLGPGDYHYEPTGTIDAWAAAGAEACVVHLRIEGDIEYLGPGDTVTCVVNSGTQAAAYQDWCKANQSPTLAPLPGGAAKPSPSTRRRPDTPVRS